MLETIALFTDCITAYEILEQIVRLDLSKTKIKLTLSDGSVIFLREIIIQNVLHDYSYHWQGADGALIIRWDNTAHYPHISTHPHHKHVHLETNVEESFEQTLYNVLSFIKNRITNI